MKVYTTCGRMAVAMALLAVGACGAGETDSKGEWTAGLRLSDEAVAADAGLPTYPGSKPYKDAEDSNAAANIGISTPMFGLNVVAMNLETGDQPERVARFYRQALSKYGSVLECRDDADREKSQQQAAHSSGLVCDSDEPGKHSVVYKVGTEENQRIVAIKPHGNGARFSLVQLDIRGDAKP